jgi:hypothetical protein
MSSSGGTSTRNSFHNTTSMNSIYSDSQQRQQLQQCACLLVHLLHVAPPTGISKLLFQAGRQQGVKACWYDLTPVSTLLLLFLLLI